VTAKIYPLPPTTPTAIWVIPRRPFSPSAFSPASLFFLAFLYSRVTSSWAIAAAKSIDRISRPSVQSQTLMSPSSEAVRTWSGFVGLSAYAMI
jgi:hypothetical protein